MATGCSLLFAGTRCLAACLALCAMSCTDLTEPVTFAASAPPRPPTEPTGTARPAPTPPPAPPAPAAPAPPSGEMVAASHILVAYQGSMRADANITRTKEEAKKRAEQLLIRARGGGDFAKLADEASDDPSAKMNHGSLGKFTRDRMVKPFADAAFSIKPGEVSSVVETPFGFHVIKRTE